MQFLNLWGVVFVLLGFMLISLYFARYRTRSDRDRDEKRHETPRSCAASSGGCGACNRHSSIRS